MAWQTETKEEKCGKSLKKLFAGIVIGCSLTLSTTVFAQMVKEYKLVESTYPVLMNGANYSNEEWPILNYNGTTYIPLKELAEGLQAKVRWNEELKRVEVRGEQSNQAFVIHEIDGDNGSYTITGEARVFEGVFQYAISDGHDYLLTDHLQLEAGAPEWAPFTIKVSLPQSKLPGNGTLMLEIYEESAKDDSRMNELFVPLQSFR